LTNDEVLNVLRINCGGVQIFKQGDQRIWLVENADSDDKYLALFNIGDQADIVETQLVMIGDAAAYDVRDLWSKTDIGSMDGNWSQGLAPHSAKLYRLRPLSQ
jgi:alpha-galactosidase